MSESSSSSAQIIEDEEVMEEEVVDDSDEEEPAISLDSIMGPSGGGGMMLPSDDDDDDDDAEPISLDNIMGPSSFSGGMAMEEEEEEEEYTEVVEEESESVSEQPISLDNIMGPSSCIIDVVEQDDDDKEEEEEPISLDTIQGPSSGMDEDVVEEEEEEEEPISLDNIMGPSSSPVVEEDYTEVVEEETEEVVEEEEEEEEEEQVKQEETKPTEKPNALKNLSGPLDNIWSVSLDDVMGPSSHIPQEVENDDDEEEEEIVEEEEEEDFTEVEYEDDAKAAAVVTNDDEFFDEEILEVEPKEGDTNPIPGENGNNYTEPVIEMNEDRLSDEEGTTREEVPVDMKKTGALPKSSTGAETQQLGITVKPPAVEADTMPSMDGRPSVHAVHDKAAENIPKTEASFETTASGVVEQPMEENSTDEHTGNLLPDKTEDDEFERDEIMDESMGKSRGGALRLVTGKLSVDRGQQMRMEDYNDKDELMEEPTAAQEYYKTGKLAGTTSEEDFTKDEFMEEELAKTYEAEALPVASASQEDFTKDELMEECTSISEAAGVLEPSLQQKPGSPTNIRSVTTDNDLNKNERDEKNTTFPSELDLTPKASSVTPAAAPTQGLDLPLVVSQAGKDAGSEDSTHTNKSHSSTIPAIRGTMEKSVAAKIHNSMAPPEGAESPVHLSLQHKVKKFGLGPRPTLAPPEGAESPMDPPPSVREKNEMARSADADSEVMRLRRGLARLERAESPTRRTRSIATSTRKLHSGARRPIWVPSTPHSGNRSRVSESLESTEKTLSHQNREDIPQSSDESRGLMPQKRSIDLVDVRKDMTPPDSPREHAIPYDSHAKSELSPMSVRSSSQSKASARPVSSIDPKDAVPLSPLTTQTREDQLTHDISNSRVERSLSSDLRALAGHQSLRSADGEQSALVEIVSYGSFSLNESVQVDQGHGEKENDDLKDEEDSVGISVAHDEDVEKVDSDGHRNGEATKQPTHEMDVSENRTHGSVEAEEWDDTNMADNPQGELDDQDKPSTNQIRGSESNTDNIVEDSTLNPAEEADTSKPADQYLSSPTVEVATEEPGDQSTTPQTNEDEEITEPLEHDHSALVAEGEEISPVEDDDEVKLPNDDEKKGAVDDVSSEASQSDNEEAGKDENSLSQDDGSSEAEQFGDDDGGKGDNLPFHESLNEGVVPSSEDETIQAEESVPALEMNSHAFGSSDEQQMELELDSQGAVENEHSSAISDSSDVAIPSEEQDIPFSVNGDSDDVETGFYHKEAPLPEEKPSLPTIPEESSSRSLMRSRRRRLLVLLFSCCILVVLAVCLPLLLLSRGDSNDESATIRSTEAPSGLGNVMTNMPSNEPTDAPTVESKQPLVPPSSVPTMFTAEPSLPPVPTSPSTAQPTIAQTQEYVPSTEPNGVQSRAPTTEPTLPVTDAPTATPTEAVTAAPTSVTILGWERVGGPFALALPNSGYGEAVAISDRIMLVGAPDALGGSGAVLSYLPDQDGGGWSTSQALYGPQVLSGFGGALDVDQGALLIGAPSYSDAGAAFFYEYTSGVFTQIGPPIIGISGDEALGSSVAVSRSRLAVVGASSSGGDAGASYIFSYDDATSDWVLQEAMIGLEAGDKLGQAVDIDKENGILVAIGAPGNGGGYVLFYEKIEGSWVNTFLEIGERIGEDFGSSVKVLSSTLVAVGSPSYMGGRGRIVVFEKVASEFIQLPEIVGGPGDQLGSQGKLAGSGTSLVVGTGSGMVKRYDLEIPSRTWLETGQAVNTTYGTSLLSIATSSSSPHFVAGGNMQSSIFRVARGDVNQ